MCITYITKQLDIPYGRIHKYILKKPFRAAADVCLSPSSFFFFLSNTLFFLFISTFFFLIYSKECNGKYRMRHSKTN